MEGRQKERDEADKKDYTQIGQIKHGEKIRGISKNTSSGFI